MQASAEAIRQVVQEVLAQLGKAPKSGAAPQRDGDWGVFQSADQAISAANDGACAQTSDAVTNVPCGTWSVR